MPYSALAEEQIICQLVKRLGVHNSMSAAVPWCVDIGAGDGITNSNSCALFKAGWAGVAVEVDPEKFAKLASFAKLFMKLQLVRCRVEPATITSLLETCLTPKDFTVLSLDIDGYDYFVLERILERYRPYIMCVEINEKIPTPVMFTRHYHPKYSGPSNHCYGMSIELLGQQASRFEYVLIGLEYNNAFLVPIEVAGKLDLRVLSAREAYAAGYLSRADRLLRLPWNREVDYLQALSPALAVEEIKRMFASDQGEFSCYLP